MEEKHVKNMIVVDFLNSLSNVMTTNLTKSFTKINGNMYEKTTK